MAQGNRGSDRGKTKPPAGKTAVVDTASGRPAVRERTSPAKEPNGPAGRQSVAAARKSDPGANRTQLTIGAVAVVLIVVVIVAGLIMNRQQTAIQGAGYGPSVSSVATLANGVVSVTDGSTPKVAVDLFQDAICPNCADFETQFGQQINQFVDSGKVQANYHMLNFLDPISASHDYSTRASAALMCVAADTGTAKGGWMRFMQNLYASGTRPAENGSSDLSNSQLADLAVKNGATEVASACIKAGKYLAQAKVTATAGSNALNAATGTIQTPTVLRDGKAQNTNDVNWLKNLVTAAS